MTLRAVAWRRKALRYPAGLAVGIEIDGSEKTFKTRDVSANGLFVVMPHDYLKAFSKGDIIAAVLVGTPKDMPRFDARIVRVGLDGIAIEYHDQ